MADDMSKEKAKTTGCARQDAGAGKNRTGRRNWFDLPILACCLLPVSAMGANETLRDPTRPPAALFAPETAGGTQTGPVLQSVRVSEGRYTAVIDGQTVKVGDRFGEARVQRIRETEVVLKSGNSLQTLKLFPDVEKRPAANSQRAKR